LRIWDFNGSWHEQIQFITDFSNSLQSIYTPNIGMVLKVNLIKIKLRENGDMTTKIGLRNTQKS
jgi:hypothetical protein